MSFDWKALTPHRPLDSNGVQYVVPPSGFAERIAPLVATGTTTVLVGGPVGVGKSTELARITALLRDERVACLVRLDRHENIRRLTPDQMFSRITRDLVELARIESARRGRGTQISAALLGALRVAGTVASQVTGVSIPVPEVSFTGSPRSLLDAALSEVARATGYTRISLIVDGLEKLPDTPESSEVLAALGQISDEVDIIAVVPWHVAFGVPEDTIRPAALFASLPAPGVDGTSGLAGRQFLADILTERLGLPREHLSENEDASQILGLSGVKLGRAMVLEAARWSGGLPRTFLQLMADAAQYAQIRRGGAWPNESDLADAIADQKDSFRRALLPGDSDAVRKVEGTDGREMELSRKIRLLARGVILERRQGSKYFLDIHPLAQPLLEGKRNA